MKKVSSSLCKISMQNYPEPTINRNVKFSEICLVFNYKDNLITLYFVWQKCNSVRNFLSIDFQSINMINVPNFQNSLCNVYFIMMATRTRKTLATV